jgi:hypothetical protein
MQQRSGPSSPWYLCYTHMRNRVWTLAASHERFTIVLMAALPLCCAVLTTAERGGVCGVGVGVGVGGRERGCETGGCMRGLVVSGERREACVGVRQRKGGVVWVGRWDCVRGLLVQGERECMCGVCRSHGCRFF